jgi:hypothetical protein
MSFCFRPNIKAIIYICETETGAISNEGYYVFVWGHQLSISASPWLTFLTSRFRTTESPLTPAIESLKQAGKPRLKETDNTMGRWGGRSEHDGKNNKAR